MGHADGVRSALVVLLLGCARVAGEPAMVDGGADSLAAEDTEAVDATSEDIAAPIDAAPAIDTSTKPLSDWQCSNGIDDDGDGLVDWLDPECATPFDDDEATFGKGIPGDGDDGAWTWCKLDCAFDGNAGAGDDGCVFSGACYPMTRDPTCHYDPDALADPKRCPAISSKCASFCTPRTPNGCDFVGCCDIHDDAGIVHRVHLRDTCSMASLSDPKRCIPCEKIEAYSKPCGRCDACLGKPNVPADCGSTCANGAPRCSASTPCPAGQWCLTGCCSALPLPF
jgi:hypothetical protein